MLAAFVAVQVILVPILGALWLGARLERQRNFYIYKRATENLHIISISRGRR